MQFLTNEECRAWLREGQRGEDGFPTWESEGLVAAKGDLGFEYGDALQLISSLQGDRECLLWVTATRIWHTNLHLYYRFRESYGDRRLVEDAPGHLFLHYEKADLLSYVQIGLQCGWDFWVLGSEDSARVFASHDEYFIEATAKGL